MRVKSNRRSHRALKIKTDKMRYKEGEKEISISAEIYNEWRANRIKSTKKPKRQNKRRLKAVKELRKKQESGRKQTGAK